MFRKEKVKNKEESKSTEKEEKSKGRLKLTQSQELHSAKKKQLRFSSDQIKKFKSHPDENKEKRNSFSEIEKEKELQLERIRRLSQEKIVAHEEEQKYRLDEINYLSQTLAYNDQGTKEVTMKSFPLLFKKLLVVAHDEEFRNNLTKEVIWEMYQSDVENESKQKECEDTSTLHKPGITK